ncbi:MAG: Adenosine monophosphate-protein transferase SoFic [bacterium ADurb.Bin425]|nr:MAG: Adenosine monophosphate-protein transferase SoFic [bacterium ADurb.Bin425]
MEIDRKSRLGERVRCSANSEEPYWALVPRPLPPAGLQLDDLPGLVEKASQSLGRLDGLATVLPDTQLFLYMYVRKEAVLSSQIEGTQSSLSDLLLYESEEAPGVPLDDVQEVSNYVAAMNHGLKRLREGFPMSMRLIREIHEVLMTGARGGTKAPGEFRPSQNWVGGTRPGNATYVPPPPDRVVECMSDLEKYLHNKEDKLPLLIRAALVHHQFETIHPFLDGNGRLGRLLITLMLCTEGVLTEPILYLSLYFKTHRKEYYAHLQHVRETGDWESWLNFFLVGVRDIATQATSAAREILALIQTDRERIADVGRSARRDLHALPARTPGRRGRGRRDRRAAGSDTGNGESAWTDYANRHRCYSKP